MAGASAIRYPVLSIEPIPMAIIERTFSPADLAHADAIIFVSANAVEYGVPVIQQYGGLGADLVFADSTWYAIGNTTADALRSSLPAGSTQQIETPSRGRDSEALLAMSALQDVAGQHIIIVCGHSEAGGRTLLQQTLRERHAVVTLLICYERKNLVATTAAQHALVVQLQSGGITTFLALSIETLDSLMNNMHDITGWQHSTLLVSHPRVADAARQRGWLRCEVVPMNNQALVEALYVLKPTLPDAS